MNLELQPENKWALAKCYIYSYIAQPPREFWDDAEFMDQREFLLAFLGFTIFKTDFNVIFANYRNHRPIQEALAAAKIAYETKTLPDNIAGFWKRIVAEGGLSCL
jgi:hypothetical protein